MAYEKKFFANGGQLFTVKDKKSEKGPDLDGTIDLGSDTVDYIIEQYNAGNQEITLALSAWKKVSRAGNKFLSVSVKKPFVKNGSAPNRSRRAEADGDAPF